MQVVVCPGMHPPELTQHFLAEVSYPLSDALIFPIDRYPAYSGFHIVQFLQQQLGVSTESTFSRVSGIPSASQAPLVFVAFSAGVVGAIAAAHLWQGLGGQVRALIALDGWGVPLYGSFGIHRISHDWFTHWSSALLGEGAESFYADPGVDHLELWRSPQSVRGHWVGLSDQRSGDEGKASTSMKRSRGQEAATRGGTTVNGFHVSFDRTDTSDAPMQTSVDQFLTTVLMRYADKKIV